MIIYPGGKLFLYGNNHASAVFNITIRGDLHLGEKSGTNYGLKIICNKKIIIGNNCLIGWNVTLIDTDGHSTFIDGCPNENCAPIVLEDHVWLGAHSSVMKGTYVGHDSVISYGTIVNGEIPPNSIVKSYTKPIIIKEGKFNWEK